MKGELDSRQKRHWLEIDRHKKSRFSAAFFRLVA
jgi:hypothetical protein